MSGRRCGRLVLFPPHASHLHGFIVVSTNTGLGLSAICKPSCHVVPGSIVEGWEGWTNGVEGISSGHGVWETWVGWGDSVTPGQRCKVATGGYWICTHMAGNYSGNSRGLGFRLSCSGTCIWCTSLFASKGEIRLPRRWVLCLPGEKG